MSQPWWGALLQSVLLLFIGAGATLGAQAGSDKRVDIDRRERAKSASEVEAAWNLRQQETLWEAQETLHRFWHLCVSANATAERGTHPGPGTWKPMRTEWLRLIQLCDRMDNTELAEVLSDWMDEVVKAITGGLPVGVTVAPDQLDSYWVTFRSMSSRLAADTRRIRRETEGP
jgi:hypothetical protein